MVPPLCGRYTTPSQRAVGLPQVDLLSRRHHRSPATFQLVVTALCASVAVVTVTTCSALLPPYPLPDITGDELDALVALHTSTNGPNWVNSWQNWKGTGGNVPWPPCRWHGVVCATFPDGPHVVELNLVANNLVGLLPDNLGRLSKLERLDLSGNTLRGTLPPRLQWFKLLRYLRLSNNAITGTLPSEMGSMSTVQYLYMDHNQLTGTIPSSFSLLTRLKELDMGSNYLTGSIPTGLGRPALSLIEMVNFEGNLLSDPVPGASADTRSTCDRTEPVATLTTVTEA